MSRKYRLGIASLVHDHVWGELNHWAKEADVEIVAAGDVNQELRDRVRADYGVPRLYGSWQAMLEAEELDLVQAAAENSAGADIVEACAARGIHVVSEKPMAATLAQANRMVAAARSAGTLLLVNWPTAWQPAIQEMERRILGGEIGRVFYFKQRSAHNGPMEIGCSPYFWKWLYDEQLNGAGALMDYCCYSADMCARFLGLPESVTGFRATLVKDYAIPDDNAIIVMKYPGAFGIAEACWTQTVPYATPNPVAYGTGGSLAVHGDEVVIETPEGRREIEPAPPVAPMQSAAQYLLHCLRTGEPVRGFCSMEVSRDAQEILEAGKRAADTGVAQSLPLASA
ncbi:MAG: Gfo/Idh/MocA family oxidoreductase [Armatimonadetes bacterium]|nr:Gfo/Idh/MocA family oxidoreductase [Armatimonadota bacterium]